ITNFHFRHKEHKKALYYINKAINIDGENPLYWKKAAKIYLALENLDEADFAFKQAVDMGNYELDTWRNWAEVLKRIGDLDSCIQILVQGLRSEERRVGKGLTIGWRSVNRTGKWC